MRTENEFNECRHTKSNAIAYVCDDCIYDRREIPYNPEFLNRMSSRGTRREGEEVKRYAAAPPALFPRHEVLQRSLSTSCLSSDCSSSTTASLDAAARTTTGVGRSSTCRSDDHTHPADFHAAVISYSTTQEAESCNSPPRRICRESNAIGEAVFLKSDSSSHQDIEKLDLVIETVIFDGECDHAELRVDHDKRQQGSRNPPEFNFYIFSAKKLVWRTQRVTNATRKNAVKLQESASPQVAAVLATTQNQFHSTIRRSVYCAIQTSFRAKQNLQEALTSSSSSENDDEISRHDKKDDDMTTDDDDATDTKICRVVGKGSNRTAACSVKRDARRASDLTAHVTRDAATATLRRAGHPTLSTKAKTSAIMVGRQFKRATRATVKGVRNF